MPPLGPRFTPGNLRDAADLIAMATRHAIAARSALPPEAIVRKPDGSIVTAVDVALQVLILTRLEAIFGEVTVIAEEDLASIGGKPAAESHCRALLRTWGYEGGEPGIARALSIGGRVGPTRDVDACWVLDPIDGTQGYVDGDHWCPCLALLACGTPVFAANGFPTVRGGQLLAGEAGGGAFWSSLDGGERMRARVSVAPLGADETLRVVAPARATARQIEMRLEVGHSTGHPCTLVHSDSQAKYAHVIAGLADVAYSRRGGGPGKYIWDHAGAVLLAREAGAWVGDTDGSAIDCSLGRRLEGNNAVICAARGVGPAIASALAERDRVEGVPPTRSAGGIA